MRLVPIEEWVNARVPWSVGATGAEIHEWEQGVSYAQCNRMHKVEKAHWMRRDHQVGHHQHRVHDVAMDVAEVNAVQICSQKV